MDDGRWGDGGMAGSRLVVLRTSTPSKVDVGMATCLAYRCPVLLSFFTFEMSGCETQVSLVGPWKMQGLVTFGEYGVRTEGDFRAPN